MKLEGRPVLVLGLARSGRAAAALLARIGARVTVYDAAVEGERARAEGLPAGVTAVGGPEPPRYRDFDTVVASPGFRLDPDPKLLPEVELAAAHLQAPLVGVTGTNGKSTTTVLIGEMLQRSGERALVGGNLGTALCSLVGEPADRIVAELSSFQLEHARALRAHTAVLTNLAPDHLDRHGTLEAYGAAKARLAELQHWDDALVYNLDDPWARATAERAPARGIPFSERAAQLDAGAFLDGKDLVVALDGREVVRVARDALSAASCAPLANALAAAACAAACGARPEAIASALEQFEGLPHRGRRVCTRGGVQWIDDSKATNPAAAAASLGAQRAPVVWIAGGRNKDLDFAPLRDALRGKPGGMRGVLLYGEAAGALEEALTGAAALERVETLDQAVQRAAELARPGDVALLAPACTSFDQFPSFEARGDHFAAAARALDPREG